MMDVRTARPSEYRGLAASTAPGLPGRLWVRSGDKEVWLVDTDERTVTVEEDAALREAARQLAVKSASLGRFYALAAMKLEDRARVVRAVEGVGGTKITVEGEGRNRRVVFTPDKPAPLPKKSLLPDDDEDDFDE